MRFNLRQLAYFVAAGESGSVTAAAQRLNVAQPSVSAALQQLENLFGLQLFVRHHARGLSLTPEGQRLLREARALLQHAEELETFAREIAGDVAGPLPIGAFVTLAPLVLPSLMEGFQRQHPAVKPQMMESHQADLLAKLRRAEIALAVTYDLAIPDDVLFEPLAELPPLALLPAAHWLAKEKAVSLKDLAALPFVLLDLPLSRDYFLKLFEAEGLKANIVARSEHPEVVRALVASGQGVGLVNVRPRTAKALDGRPLALRPIKGRQQSLWLGLATLRGLRKGRALLAFEDYCRQTVTSERIPGMQAL